MVTGTLTDVRGISCANIPLETFNINAYATYVKVQLKSPYGSGIALKFIGFTYSCTPKPKVIESDNSWKGSSAFLVDNVLVDGCSDNGAQNYLVAEHSAKEYSFTLDLGCSKHVAGVQLRNTGNGHHADRYSYIISYGHL